MKEQVKDLTMQPARIWLKPNCPIGGLNDVFTKGILVLDREPTIEINGQLCLMLPLVVEGLALKPEVLERVMAVIMTDECPLDIQLCATQQGFVPIDPDWVDAFLD